MNSIEYISHGNERRKNQDEALTQSEIEELQALVEQLGWVAGETKPDLSFEVCQLNSCFNHSTMNDTIKGKKL